MRRFLDVRSAASCRTLSTRYPSRRLFFLAFLGLALASPPGLPGQELRDLGRGDRVRVTPSDGPSLRGSFLGLGPRGLSLLDSSEGEFTIPVSSLRVLEMSAGRNRKKGGLIGGGVGLVAGLLLGAATSGDCYGACDDPYGVGGDDLVEATATGLGAIMGGVIFGAVGAGAGATFFAPERWVTIELGSAGRITPTVRMRR